MKATISNKFNIFILLSIIYFLTYFYNAYLANHLRADEYGKIALIMRVMVFSMPFLLLGSNQSMFKFLSVYLDKQEYEYYYGFNHWAIKEFIYGIFILFIINLSFIVISIVVDLFGIYSLNEFNPLIYSIWLMPLYSLMVYQATLLRCLKQVKISNLSGSYPALSLVFLFFLVYYNPPIEKFGVIISIGISISLILILQHFFIRKYSPPKVKKKTNKDLAKQWKKVSIQLMWNSVIYIGISSIDIFMMEILDNPIRVGMLSVVIIITNIFPIIENSSNSIMVPSISPLIFENKKQELQKLFNHSVYFRVSIGIIIALIILVFNKEILSHFGALYLSLSSSLIFLSIAYILYLWFSPASMFLMYSGHQNILLKINFVQLLIVIILDIFLIPLFHVKGAVISLIVGFLFAEFLSLLALRLYMKIKVFIIF